MGEFEGHGCWVPNTPVKSGPSICKDAGDLTKSGGVDDDGFHHWQAALMETPLPDAIASKSGDLKPTSTPSESIFNTGFEGTRFEPSFATPLVDNKFIAVGQNMWINSNYVPPTTPNGDPTPSQRSVDLSSSSLFAPITPDQSRKAENSHICSNQTPDNQLVNESSCADVSTQVGENHNLDTDQQKTPQQKPRRKKHRPKVVKEGQAKRGRKPTTPKPEVNKETTPTGKRKYVRKNKTQGLPEGAENKDTPRVKRKYVKRKGVDKTREISTGELLSQWADTKKETHGQKSCKKRLNFDDDCSVVEESSLCNENAESQAQNFQIMAGNAKNESKIGKCQIVFSDKTHDKEGPVLEMQMNNNNNTKPAPSLKRRSKNMIGSHYNSLSKYEAFLFPAYSYDVSGINVPTTVETKKPKKRHSKTTSNASSSKTAAENNTKEVAPYIFNNAYMTSGTSFYPSRYQTQTLSFGAQLQQQSFEYQLLLEHATMMKEMKCHNAAMVYGLSSVVENVERNQVPCHTAGGSSQCGYLQIYQSGNPGHAYVDIKGSKARKTRKNRMRKRGVARKKNPTVDDITEYLKQLQIDSMNKEKNALVSYGRDGAVVPFGGSFNPMKKHRPRAKVNLDSETDRVWKLLLENINSEGIDGTDEEKAKWWEEERRVFQGRADSFIARMHLVQGDRRFSPWKGSVVDSVVGVFLTQNVSDHASSSAFMSLAAHFPTKSEVRSEPCSKEDITDKEQKVQITEPEDNSKSSNPNGPHTTFMELLRMAENQKGFQDREIGCISSCTENVHHFMNTQNFSRGMYNQNTPNGSEENCASEQSEITVESGSQDTVQKVMNVISADVETGNNTEHKQVESSMTDPGSTPDTSVATSEPKKGNTGKKKEKAVDWDMLRVKAEETGKRERTADMMDSLDWEAVWRADVDEVAGTIKARGMSNVLAGRIQAFLERIVTDHGSIDLEWLRDAPPDKTKEYLLSFRGLGLKSVECVRLLTLHHLAFPVDTNVGRIAVRLGWVPLQTLPESLQLHLLELYPVLESIQQYLWPRLCKLDQRTLYELHYQMITFGKVFCTKSKPNCNACPMRGECRHFASAFASARLALPGPEDKSIVNATGNKESKQTADVAIDQLQLPEPQPSLELLTQPQIHMCRPTVKVPIPPIFEEPIVEVPNTPEPEIQVPESDIEDAFLEDPEEIPTIRLNLEKFTQNLQSYMERNLQDGDISKALVALTQEAASIPMPKLKNVNQLRTEHQVYELPDSHPLLEGLDKRESDDPCSYLLAIWTPGETANSVEQPEYKCNSSQELGNLCEIETCFSCNSVREANSQTVRGTLLIPCRTAMRGSFPLNGTYFQVNEVFADHASSIKPIDVPRSWIWNLPRRIVYFGTSIPTIFKGLSTESIQYCFWRGFVCVRGFDQKTRAPRPLMARLHFPASKLPKASGKTDEKKE